MAVTVGRLAIQLSAQTGFLKAGFGKARAQVSGFVSTTTRKMAGLKNVLIGTFAAVTGGAAIKGLVNDIDELGKASTRLGIGVEELQNLEHAAKLAGVSTNTLRMALQRMGRRISQAADGTGEAVLALEEMELSAKALERAGPAQAFRDIADAISKYQNPLDRIRLSQKLFDSEGVALVNVLRQGSRAIDNASRELDELGRITQKDAELAAEFNDALLRVTQAAKILFVQLSRALLPVLTAIGKVITNVTNALRNIDVDFLKTGLRIVAFVGVMLFTIRVVNKAITVFRNVTKAIKAFSAAQVLAEAVATGGTSLAKAAIGLAAGTAAVIGLNAAFDELAVGAASASDKVKDSSKEISDNLKNAAAGVEGVGEAKFGGAGGAQRQGAGAAARVGTVQGFSEMMKARQNLDRMHNIDRQQLNETKKGNQVLMDIREVMRARPMLSVVGVGL